MAQHDITPPLKVLLADTYTLYLKTQNYHWNVVGPNFSQFHQLFETQYQELALAVDKIAERIREIGDAAPGSFDEFAKLKTITEAKNKIDALAMVKDLKGSHDAICREVEGIISKARELEDESTQDLMIERLEAHQKACWMLGAHLE